MMVNGISLGIFTNTLIEATTTLFVSPIFSAFVFLLGIISLILGVTSHGGIRMKKRKKMKLIFLGISISSLIYAVADLVRFAVGFKGVRIDSNFPYLWLGDIPFISLLSSLVLGALFSTLERLWDIHT